MDWQQGVLIVLACVVGGLVVGYVSSYLIITQIFKEPFKGPFSKRRATTASGERFKPVGPQR